MVCNVWCEIRAQNRCVIRHYHVNYEHSTLVYAFIRMDFHEILNVCGMEVSRNIDRLSEILICKFQVGSRFAY